MSLFKTRDFWSTKAGDNEEYDLGCLAIGDVDNKQDGDKIVLGSYSGYIRIYSPSPTKTEEGWSGFKAQDLLCETHIQSTSAKQVKNNKNYPIIQIECGSFVSGSSQVHIAVLHPLKLSIYTLLMNSGVTEYGNQYHLKMVYEHNFQHTAYNFCHGPFGGVSGRDFICVQSMDGALSLYEQESFSFTRYLPNFLLPGPLAYVARVDCFVTASSARMVECYKYRVLAVASDNKPKDNRNKDGDSKDEQISNKSGKKVSTDWTFELGEQTLQISVLNHNSGPSNIYVLGERNFFIISDSGKLKNMIKFELNPSYCFPYKPTPEGNVHLLISTHTHSLIVYSNMTLKWAAQLDFVPVQLKIITIGSLCGLILMLSTTGEVSCCYLGTDPSMFAINESDSREMDYEKCDQELRNLHERIKEHAHKFTVAPSANSKDEDLSLSIEVAKDLDLHSAASESHKDSSGGGFDIPSITVRLTLQAKVPIMKCSLSLSLPSPFVTPDPSNNFTNLEPNTTRHCEFTIYLGCELKPSSLLAKISIYYEKDPGIPKINSTEFRLPLKLVARTTNPLKNANLRITIESNKPSIHLNQLFSDMSNDPDSLYALGFRCFHDKDVVTLLASKSSQRYRLQCDSLAPMNFVLIDLTTRLFANYNKGDLELSYDGELPLQPYFDVIDQHFTRRQIAVELKKQLANRTAEFRSVEKRLLSRFKDKTPTSLNNFDTIIEKCYNKILSLTTKIEENQRLLLSAGNELSASTRLLLQLVQLGDPNRFKRSRRVGQSNDSEIDVLSAALCPDIHDGSLQGWEETVDASLTHLLRTSLSKQSRDPSTVPATSSSLCLPSDTGKLKKHLKLLFDRLASGANICTGAVTTADIMDDSQEMENSNFSKQISYSMKSENKRPHKSLQSIIERENTSNVPDLDTL